MKIRKKEPLEAMRGKDLSKLPLDELKEWFGGRYREHNSIIEMITFVNNQGSIVSVYGNDLVIKSLDGGFMRKITDQEFVKLYEVVEDE